MTDNNEKMEFKCEKRKLLTDLLQNLERGKLQLPDFQRGWVWTDDMIRKLLASVSLGHPIGSILLLECAEDQQNFQSQNVRYIEGTSGRNANACSPGELILDGQQRLTSLYAVFYSEHDIKIKDKTGSKKKGEKRKYYFKIEECLNNDLEREQAIESHEANKTISREEEFEKNIFPLSVIANESHKKWFRDYRKFYKHSDKVNVIIDNFQDKITDVILSYEVPSIWLYNRVSRKAICQVFENINTGGVPLKTFELLTATYAIDNFKLREDWRVQKNYLNRGEGNSVLENVDENIFIQAVTLYANYKNNISKNSKSLPECRNEDILSLKLKDYKKYRESVAKGFMAAAAFLVREKILKLNLPYTPQLISLASIFTFLGENVCRKEETKKRIRQWYWSGVFSQAYGGSSTTRISNDLYSVCDWVENDKKPDFLDTADFNVGAILTAKTRGSAVYKGMMVLLKQQNSEDFKTGDHVEDAGGIYGVDVHHIFPKKYCENEKYSKTKMDSIVNKTRILSTTNQYIQDLSPKEYLQKLEDDCDINSQRLEKRLKNHLIDYKNLIDNDFETFIIKRSKCLIALISEAVGKSINKNDEEIKKFFIEE